MRHPPGGWIKAHRRLFDPDFGAPHPWPSTWRYYFLDLIQLAQYEPHGELARGQLNGSIRYLAHRWTVGKATVGRFLERLESDGAIKRERLTRDTQRDGGGTDPGTVTGVITVCNYKTYQADRTKAGHPPGRKRDTPRDESKTLRSKNLPGSDGKRPHPPSAAAPAKPKPTPTQRIDWPPDMQTVWDGLLAGDLLGTDIDNPSWWRKQLDWTESSGVEIFLIPQLKAYVAHQASVTKSKVHRSPRAGFRKWLAMSVRWKQIDAARQAVRENERRDR